MNDKIFLDTNILVYALDNKNPRKRDIAREVLRKLSKSKSATLSTQILQEYFVVATKKLGIEPLVAKKLINLFQNFEIIVPDLTLINTAIDTLILNKLSFWDSMVIVAAAQANCSAILTEDLNNGQIINGVKIVNPFI